MNDGWGDLVAFFAPRPRDLRLSFNVIDADRASLAQKLHAAGVDATAPRSIRDSRQRFIHQEC